VGVIKAIFLLIRAFLVSRLSLAAEILALRQQVPVYKHTVKRPKLRRRDRIFWVWLSRLWPKWRSALAIVQPQTVVKWHQQGFKLYWRWKSRGRKPGRPVIERELRDLIRRMSRENPLWGAPRILSELLLLGYKAAERTVAKYMVRKRKPPSQTWRTFLANHIPDIAACDFFTVPTVTFRVLYVFIVLRHDRRRVVHFNVTDHPYAEWAAQQIIDAPVRGSPTLLATRSRRHLWGLLQDARQGHGH
jgi:putative transposase